MMWKPRCFIATIVAALVWLCVVLLKEKMWRWDLTHFNRCSRVFNVYIALWIYRAAFGEKFTMHDSFQVPKHCEHYFSGHVLCSDFFVACRRWEVFCGLLFQLRIIMANPWLVSGDDILKKLLTIPVVAHEKLLRCLLSGCFYFFSKQLMHPFGADFPVIQLFDHFITVPSTAPVSLANCHWVIVWFSQIFSSICCSTFIDCCTFSNALSMVRQKDSSIQHWFYDHPLFHHHKLLLSNEKCLR